jgi:hypothetical protein
MKILVLSSNARGYGGFFSGVAADLRDKYGHEVIMASENRLSDYLDGVNYFDGEAVYASDFVSQLDATIDVPDNFPSDELSGTTLVDLDRVEEFRTFSDSTRLLLEIMPKRYLSFLLHLFAQFKFDAVVFEGVSSTFGYVAYLVCRYYSVPFIGLSGARLPGRSEIHDGLQGIGADLKFIYENIDLGFISQEEADYIENYLKNFFSVQLDYMKGNALLVEAPFWRRYFSLSKLRIFAGLLSYQINYAKKDLTLFQTGSPVRFAARMLSRAVGRRIRLSRVEKLYDSLESVKNCYYLYPLHFHPESSTSVGSPDYINEYEVIRRIASQLPDGTMLVVKDHRSAAGFPSFDFYRRLKHIPNVRLLHYSCDTKALIKDCLAVVTLTSTVGHEALVMGKSVILLGEVFYKYHPDCHQIKSISEFGPKARQLRASIQNSNGIDNEKIRKYLLTYFRHTFPGVIKLDGSRPDISFARAVNDFLRKS